MGFIYSIVAALCLWIVLWALQMKAIDAFLIAAAIMFVAVGVKMMAQYAPKRAR